MTTSKSERFFLTPSDTSSDLKFIAKKKKAESCTFLIDGIATFKRMEEVILGA